MKLKLEKTRSNGEDPKLLRVILQTNDPTCGFWLADWHAGSGELFLIDKNNQIWQSDYPVDRAKLAALILVHWGLAIQNLGVATRFDKTDEIFDPLQF